MCAADQRHLFELNSLKGGQGLVMEYTAFASPQLWLGALRCCTAARATCMVSLLL